MRPLLACILLLSWASGTGAQPRKPLPDPSAFVEVPPPAMEEDPNMQADDAPAPSGDPRKGAGPLRAPAPGDPQGPGRPRRGTWIAMPVATLQALDKVNARAQTLTVRVGETGHYGSLDIAVGGCFVRGADQPADATAQLIVRDRNAETPVFSGWMIRSAPYVSMLAHPIFDVRIAGCAAS